MADPGSVVAMAEPPLMASAGALGDEMKIQKKRKKSKKSKKDSTDRISKKAKPMNPPAYDEAPLSEKSNLAGRVDYYLRSPLGVKRRDIKVAKPYHQVNLTTEPFITFSIQANKNEFIRFNPESLTLVFYGTYANPARDPAAAANTEAGAERHALRASELHPNMFVDPSVMGTGFFHKVEVYVDNVPCLSNSDLNSMNIQYTRMSRIFNHKPTEPYFATRADFNHANASEALKAGRAPFDAADWNTTEGYRMPVFLDGYFPFSTKNRTLESIDKSKDPNLYFPPDTTITVKLHAHRTKLESIFHPELANDMNEYFNHVNPIADLDELGLRFTILEAIMEYESVQLHPLDHADVMKAYRAGGSASYNYDRIACQHSALMPGVSQAENRFQIPPHARLIYILFLHDYAAFTIEAMRRPLSGFTRFPQHCTNMSVEFAGERNLIHERLENFGVRGRRVEASKRIYWKSLKADRMIAAKFSQMFPQLDTNESVIQALCLNMRNHVSKHVETLHIQLEFAGANQSPERQQIVVMSVHPTGVLQCRQDNGRWNWEFGTRNFE